MSILHKFLNKTPMDSLIYHASVGFDTLSAFTTFLPICDWQVACKVVENAFLGLWTVGPKQTRHFLIRYPPLAMDKQ